MSGDLQSIIIDIRRKDAEAQSRASRGGWRGRWGGARFRSAQGIAAARERFALAADAECPKVCGLAVPGMEGLFTQRYDVLIFDQDGRTAVYARH